MKAISLLYHDVVEEGELGSSGFSGGDADIYKLTVREFSAHLAAIQAASEGCTVTTAELPGDGTKPLLMLTFDDGGVSAYEHTADLLESYGWRGTFFITTDRIGTRGFMDRAQIRNLHDRGHTIGSHSCSHPPRISHLDDQSLRREWSGSVSVLEEITGGKVHSASVPAGFYTRRVARFAAEAGIVTVFTSEPTSRVSQAEGCRILGRYSIQAGCPPEIAAAYVRELPSVIWKQTLFWNTKKVLKAVGGEYWLAARKRLLASK